METDEIIYAVGELYLKYRKGQQIVVDQQRQIAAHEQELQQLRTELEEAQNPKPAKKGRK